MSRRCNLPDPHPTHPTHYWDTKTNAWVEYTCPGVERSTR